MDTIKIRTLRIQCGMTISELAKASGITRVSVYHYENGQRIPRLDVAKKIAAALNCTVDDLTDKE